jgi:hypothetical protein
MSGLMIPESREVMMMSLKLEKIKGSKLLLPTASMH